LDDDKCLPRMPVKQWKLARRFHPRVRITG
jgi:hypothetical protein